MKFFNRNMPINTCAMALALSFSSVLSIPMASSAGMGRQDGGTITLTLQGVIDLEHPKSSTEPYLVEGRLSGNTSSRFDYINYHKEQDTEWQHGNYALIALSSSSGYCETETISERPPGALNGLQKIPGVNKIGLKLVHADGDYAFIVPSLGFNIQLGGSDKIGRPGWVKSSYSGVFFQPSSDLPDRAQNTENRQWNICRSPAYETWSPGGKSVWRQINISMAGPLELYSPTPMKPGRYSYRGQALYIGSYGHDNPVDAVTKLQVNTNLNVVRVCSISDVSQDHFSITAGREHEIIRQSSFSVSAP